MKFIKIIILIIMLYETAQSKVFLKVSKLHSANNNLITKNKQNIARSFLKGFIAVLSENIELSNKIFNKCKDKTEEIFDNSNLESISEVEEKDGNTEIFLGGETVNNLKKMNKYLQKDIDI